MAKNKIVYKPRELTFKQKRMIVKAQKNLFNDNYEGKLSKHDGHWMWYHVCPVEKTEMFRMRALKIIKINLRLA